jgi:CheY-like chemotaxis protein
VNQLLGKKVMERLGHRVQIAPNGQEAVNMVKNSPYDIVFMDVHMPKMDGIDATRKIREWEKNINRGEKGQKRRIPIIAATADAMEGDSERFMEAGMDGYISKPFKRGDIQRAINGWVHRSGEAEIEKNEKRVLVVEDEEKMRKSIIRLLRRKMPHIKVMTSSDGIDAAAKLGSFFPDLILADIMMPHMDGAEFVRYIRNNKRYENIKVIMMTGLHKEDPRVRAVERAGIEHMIFKPWEDIELITAIKKAISGGNHLH